MDSVGQVSFEYLLTILFGIVLAIVAAIIAANISGIATAAQGRLLETRENSLLSIVQS